jgi:hypothetical protein
MVEKGIFEFEINGEKVGFKFGMYAAAITQKEAGMSIFELLKVIAKGQDGGVALQQYFYGGLVSYCTNKKLPIPTLDQVGDVIEVIGFDSAMDVYAKSLESYIPKKKEKVMKKKK